MGDHTAMSNENELDLELLAGVARGDRQALGQLYDRFAPLMLGVGIRMLKSRAESEDVVQDVFLEVWKRAGDFDPRRGRVKTWIMLRMRSRCLDRIKSPRVQRARALDVVSEAQTRVESDAEATVDGHIVRNAVVLLTDIHRDVLMLGYFEGLSSSEIAARLEIPIGTVKSRTKAAVNKLRTALSADGPVP